MKTFQWYLRLLCTLLIGYGGYLYIIRETGLKPGAINIPLRASGKIAFLFLTGSLLVSPISQWIPLSYTSFRLHWISLRKIFGIAGCFFFLFHGGQYLALELTYFDPSKHLSFAGSVLTNLLHRPDAFSGVVAGSIMGILGITSNTWSVQILGSKTWKYIHILAYPLFIVTLFHIAFASRFDFFYTFLTFVLVGIRTIAYREQIFSYFSKETTPITTRSSQKYLCVPCGFIYDPTIGDPDSGILPGTLFEDIPEDWRCPVCGVTKADFILIRETGKSEKPNTNKNSQKNHAAQIQAKNWLTPTVLQLYLCVPAFTSLPGQFIRICFQDNSGEFERSYSLVSCKNGQLELAIKIKPDGRGGMALSAKNVGDTLKIMGPFGKFHLQDTTKPQIFFATSTGLSPILSLMENSPSDVKKILYFGVSTEKELFYLDRIRAIPNTTIHIYLSQENNPTYHSGRIQLKAFTARKTSEIYLCGNPKMVKELSEELMAQGYHHITTETF